MPPEIIAAFGHVVVDEDGGDFFNDLGRKFPRDNTNRVADNNALIERVNDYTYEVPWCSKAKACCYTAFSCGCYYIRKRRVVPAGMFGHYVSMERHMLKPAGRHVLFSDQEYWLGDVCVDDESQLKREFGAKTVIVVPENHVAGAFRVGKAEEADGSDGDFVLIGQGRHVLDSSRYREVVISKLEASQVQLGPVTVLYIKEGFLGGAYDRTTGVYETFEPGPPYLLHEKDYEEIVLQERLLDGFKVGPITFVTVKDGQMGGAYEKSTGQYQLLPPGNTYRLHKKEYDQLQIVNRTNVFKLGPYTFITVQNGYVAGAFRQKGGDFVLLVPGFTYQLNENDFKDPEIAKRDQHVVTCGPLTCLTLQEGMLMGAYRTSDGRFQEFSEEESASTEETQFVLHDRDYHGLKVVSKYSREVQHFGPKMIVTIPEGSCGVFERQGHIEIKDPGFYRVSAEYRINENIPLYNITERFEGHDFRTKDSVRMRLDALVVWRVEDALRVAKWPGSLEDLRAEFRSKALSSLVMLLRAYSRAHLQPTKQDVIFAGNEEAEHGEMDILMKHAQDASRQVTIDTEDTCLEKMNQASFESGWGVQVVSVKIDSLELADEQIINDMQAIDQSLWATKRKQMEGRAELAAANVDREGAMQKARAMAEVKQTEAESMMKVKIAEARAQSEISRMEAAGVKAMAEAHYEKGRKEQEVAAMMPAHEVELKRLELVVEGLKHFGAAAWRHPEDAERAHRHLFWEEMKPFMRLGPMTAAEMKGVYDNKAAAQFPGMVVERELK